MECPQVSILATRSLVESSYFSLQMSHSGCSPREEPLLCLLLSISNDREAITCLCRLFCVWVGLVAEVAKWPPSGRIS